MEFANRTPEINRAVNNIYFQAETLNNFIERIHQHLPLVENDIDQTMKIVITDKNFLVKTENTLKQIAPFIKYELILLRDMCNSLENHMDASLLPSTGNLENLKNKYLGISEGIKDTTDMLDFLNKTNNPSIVDFSNNLKYLKNKIQDQIDLINKIDNSINDEGKIQQMAPLNYLKPQKVIYLQQML